MKDKFAHISRTIPVYLFILPLFFVLHGFRENYDFVPLVDALKLTGVYLLAAIAFFMLGWLFFRNIRRAGLLAFLIMAFHFFFGSIHDALKDLFPAMIFSKYSFILPLSLLIFIILVIYLKKKKPALVRLTRFLNILLLVLFFADLIWMGFILARFNKETGPLPQGFQTCDTCKKPDIYFIIADEYAGNTELKELFSFDNSEFISKLDQRGFRTIPYSYSNYNYTPFSISSILNMAYLRLDGTNRTRPNYVYSLEKIRDNQLLRFLQHHGYDLYNYSFFDMGGQPARVRETFLPAKIRLITTQTFLKRIDRDLRFHLVTGLKSEKEIKWRVYSTKTNNDNILDLTHKKAKNNTSRPKFIFTHLMMPHYPYYFDKNGNERAYEFITEGTQINQEHYVEYLQYCNKIFLGLIDEILAASEEPPIIVFMGDHGFRHFTTPVSQHYHFLNHISVHLPQKNYPGFSDTMSSVNLWRTVLNSSFGQKLAMLKDSSSYLAD